MSLLGLALLAFTPSASAETIPQADYSLKLPAYDLKLRDYNFPSGLRIIFQEEHSQPIVAITTVIDHGSGSDPDAEKGIAHLVEHMNFRAKHEGLPKNMDYIKQVGGNFNASTSVDWTNYMTIAPKDSMVDLLKLEGLRLTDTLEGVTEDDVNTEREVVRNELRQRYENAIGDALSSINKQLFPVGHPYHIPTIGTHEGIDHSDLAAVKAFTAKYYVPANATIVVAGDFSLDDTGDIINKAFGDMPQLLVDPEHPDAELTLTEAKSRIKPERPPVPPPVDKGPVRVEGLVDTETVVVGWTMPAGFHEDQMSMQLAVNLVQSAMISQMYRDWNPVTDDPIEGVGCYLDPNKEASMALCFMEPTGGMSPEKTIEEIGDSLYTVWEPIDTASMQGIMIKRWQDWTMSNSKAQQMAGVLRTVDEVSALYGRATALAHHAHYTGSPTYFRDTFNEIPLADLEQAKTLAKTYLTRDRMVSVIVEPLSEEEKARRHAAVATGAEEHAYHGTQAATAFETIVDPSKLTPEALKKVVVVPDRTKIRELELENGLQVVIMPYGEAPLVHAGLFVYGGDDISTPWGLDAFSEWVTYRGDRIEATESLGQVAGAYYEQAMSNGRHLVAEGASGNLDAMLRRLRQESSQFGWRPADKAAAIRSGRNAMKSSGKSQEAWSERLLWERLAPGHPLGQWKDQAFYQGEESWSMEQVKPYMLAKYAPDNATLVVVGDLDPDAAEASIRSMFGGWARAAGAGGELPELLGPFAAQPDRQVLILDKPEANQFEINVACQAAPVGPEGVAALELMGDVMSEEAWRTLREREGLTYGAYAYTRAVAGGANSVHGWTLVQADAVGFSVDAFLKIFEQTARGEVDEAMLASAKWSRARKYVLGHQSGSQMLDRLQSVRAQGQGYDFFDQYPGHLAAVSAQDFPALLAPCIGHEVVTVIGPAVFAEQELPKYGIAYEVVDWEALADQQLTPKELKKAQKARAKQSADEG
ncbi:MAG: insulinase family protein [Deltaproteobacteria bacterium]|nr:insulinase family protein [Deltaproteobacteria bacterium]